MRAHRFRIAVFPALLAVALAGCADLRWHKPGVDAAALEKDSRECRQLARLQSEHQAWSFGFAPGQVIGVDRAGRPMLLHPFPRDSDRFLLEQDLARSCMRGKGYELAPEPPASARN